MQLLIFASSLAKQNKKKGQYQCGEILVYGCIWMQLTTLGRNSGNRQITICPMCCGGSRTFLIFHEHCHFAFSLYSVPFLSVYIVLWLLIWVERGVEFPYTCWSYFIFVIKGPKWKSCIAFDGNENNRKRLSYASRESYCAE